MPVEKDEVGAKIDYPGLTYAPINEQGVVALFSMMADEIGFSIEAIRQGFPDALVVDYRANRERGVKRKIEFEFESSRFPKQEDHDVTKCDIIVCWEHNWKTCPKELEVIELRTMIQKDKLERVKEEHPTETLAIRKVEKRMASPVYMTQWGERMNWIEPSTRDLAYQLIERLRDELRPIVARPKFRWYFFYRGPHPYVRKNAVATVLVGKKNVKLSIRVNPGSFSDPDGISKPMRGFFFPKGSERRMPVTRENIEAVVKLARSAYAGLSNGSYPEQRSANRS